MARGKGTSRIIPDLSRRLTLESLERRLLLSGTAAEWIAQGPGVIHDGQTEGISNNPVIGAIHTVAAHPTDADTLYIGAVNGGVWKTTDATAGSPNWVPQTDFQDSLSIGALEFDPTDATHETLIAGIGRFSAFGRRGGARTGLLLTDDGGGTWTPLDSGGVISGVNASGVAARGNIIVASSNGGDAGIYRSTDTGVNFDLLSNDGTSGLPAGAASDLVGDSGTLTRLYAALLPTVDRNTGAITVNGGIYRSDDTGATWVNVTNVGLDAAINQAPTVAGDGLFYGTNNIEIAVHDSVGGNAIYVGVIFRGQANGFFHSDDLGATWTTMAAPAARARNSPMCLSTGAPLKPNAKSRTTFPSPSPRRTISSTSPSSRAIPPA